MESQIQRINRHAASGNKQRGQVIGVKHEQGDLVSCAVPNLQLGLGKEHIDCCQSLNSPFYQTLLIASQALQLTKPSCAREPG
jgi:hypothetical protein